MIIDFHVHTKYSFDACIDPRKLIHVAKIRRLDGIAVTDHDTTRGWGSFSNVDSLKIIQGIERTTDRGSIIGLFLNEMIKSQGFWETIDEIQSQDGVVVLPHPCDSLRSDTPQIDLLDRESLKARIDAVEVFNSRCVLSRFNKKAEKVAEDLNLHRIGGSDAHTIREVGNARTLFDCGSLEEIHVKLKKQNPINTIVQGRHSSRFVHLSSFLNRRKGKSTGDTAETHSPSQ
ncbi:hypothetical protein CL673_09640 [Candidatus Bathyarchaeota archaeon]|nr:hypothetical protein [Candidatus Bathyarchaeota archaeon]MDP6049359.1 PHP domain-containing protein [Candidatus Bathyarchaeota archaeon]MDP7442961.1 PHP domain-containing protein [Candidatus Bathyarchaeota archaeon]